MYGMQVNYHAQTFILGEAERMSQECTIISLIILTLDKELNLSHLQV